MITGWYALEKTHDGKMKPVSEAENRHCLALAEAQDIEADLVGYWNGSSWEDIEPVS